MLGGKKRRILGHVDLLLKTCRSLHGLPQLSSRSDQVSSHGQHLQRGGDADGGSSGVRAACHAPAAATGDCDRQGSLALSATCRACILSYCSRRRQRSRPSHHRRSRNQKRRWTKPSRLKLLRQNRRRSLRDLVTERFQSTGQTAWTWHNQPN